MIPWLLVAMLAVGFLGPIAGLFTHVPVTELRDTLASPGFLKALGVTLAMDGLGSLIACVGGMGFARVFAGHDWPGKRLAGQHFGELGKVKAQHDCRFGRVVDDFGNLAFGWHAYLTIRFDVLLCITLPGTAPRIMRPRTMPRMIVPRSGAAVETDEISMATLPSRARSSISSGSNRIGPCRQTNCSARFG